METGKDIADEIRRDYAKSYWSETSLTRDGGIPKVKAIDSGELADRIENASKGCIGAEAIKYLQETFYDVKKFLAELTQCQVAMSFGKRIEDAIAILVKADKAVASSNPANNAACRSALDEILEKIDKWRTDGLMEHWQYSQLFDIADNAIAEPARNCDKYDTEPEARKAFLSEKCKDPCGDCSVQPNEDALCHQCGIKWLFSKEG